MRLVNKLLCCLAVIIPVAALAGCASGGTSGAASGSPPEQSNIVLDAVPTADTAGLYIARDKGFFAQQGLQVTIYPVSGDNIGITDLQHGKAQLAAGGYTAFIQAQIAGKFALPDAAPAPVNLRIIANTSQMQPGSQALYVMPNSRYSTLARLANAHAVVGVDALDNMGSILLGSLLAENGYPLKSVTQQHDYLLNMPLLLAQHKVAAAWLPEPLGTQAEQEYGAVPVADFDQGALENFPIGTIVGNAKWIRTHPNTVTAFLRALNEGQRLADTNRVDVEQALFENHVAPTQRIAATMTLDTYPTFMDVPVMQRVADAMYEFGIISKPYNIATMIQPEPGMTGK